MDSRLSGDDVRTAAADFFEIPSREPMPFYRFEQFTARLLTPHLPAGAAERLREAEHERCVHVLSGSLDMEVDGERKRCGRGDIAHVSRGGRWSEQALAPTRLALVESTACLEQKIDAMSPEEQARARVERKAN
jgi:hypothetical protein